MRKTVIIYDKEEFKDTGTICIMKFSARNSNIFDKREFKEFKELLLGQVYSLELYDAQKVLGLQCTDTEKISDRILRLNTEFEDDIKILSLKRVSTRIYFDNLEVGINNNNKNIAVLLYLNNTKKKDISDKEKKKEIGYTDFHVFICRILSHIVKYRPLCVKEGDLAEEIRELESGKGYKKFLKEAVLSEQMLDDKRYNKPIGKLLEDHGVVILDFEFITE